MVWGDDDFRITLRIEGYAELLPRIHKLGSQMKQIHWMNLKLLMRGGPTGSVGFKIPYDGVWGRRKFHNRIFLNGYQYGPHRHSKAVLIAGFVIGLAGH